MEDDHKQRQDEWLISISLNRNVTGFKRAQLLAVPRRQRESVMRRRRAKKKNIPKWRQGYFLQYANEGQTFFPGKIEMNWKWLIETSSTIDICREVWNKWMVDAKTPSGECVADHTSSDSLRRSVSGFG